MSDTDVTRHQLMSTVRIERTITRIAYQIQEDTRGSDKLVIYGIENRGYRLAVILAQKLSEIYQLPLTARPITVKIKENTGSGSDTGSASPPSQQTDPQQPPSQQPPSQQTGPHQSPSQQPDPHQSLSNQSTSQQSTSQQSTSQQSISSPFAGDKEASGDKKVIIVDDVMYSGRTMFKALQLITANTDPEEIRLAALIDRGHRRYPLHIDYLGMYHPTKLKEHVHCSFSNDGKPEGVWLYSAHDDT